MTSQKKEELLNHNTQELSKLNINYGYLLKALFQWIHSNGNTYIRLSEAAVNGFCVKYAHIEGDETLVKIGGNKLGLTVTPTTLDAHET